MEYLGKYTSDKDITTKDRLADYLLKTDASGLYLPRTGGTLSGCLVLEGGHDTKLVIDNTDDETYWSKISFRDKGTEYGYLGTTGSTDLVWNGNVLLHASNFNSYAPTLTGVGASGLWYIDIAGGSAVLKINNTKGLRNCLQYIQTAAQTEGLDLPNADWYHVLKMNHETGDEYYKRNLAFDFFSNAIYTNFTMGGGVWRGDWKQLAFTDGSNSTGTWAISTTGNAATATNADTVDNEHASAFAHRQGVNDLVHSGNEITMIPDAFTGALWFNYRTASWATNGAISSYNMGSGAAGYAMVVAKGFAHSDYMSDSYVLTANGGASAISGLHVAHADCASKLCSYSPALCDGWEYNSIHIDNAYAWGNETFDLTGRYSNWHNGIVLDWYASRWMIGNLRSGDTSSAGFGFGFYDGAEGSKMTLKAVLTTDGVFHSYGLYVHGATSLDGATTFYGSTNFGGQQSVGNAGSIYWWGHFHLDSINGYDMYLNHYSANNIVLVTGGGNVGIGTTAAAYKLDVSGTTRTNGLIITNSTQSIEITVDADGNLRFNGNIYATGQVAAGGIGSGGSSSGGLIQSVKVNSELGGTFDVNDRTNTFNAYAINAIHNRVAALESGSGSYLSLGGGTLTGNLTGTTAIFSGRIYNAGDDEGVLIKPASNGYAALILGSTSARRSVFYLSSADVYWRYVDASGIASNITHPQKTGTIALTSDIPTKASWNYDDVYAKKDGTGASGTWGINISGNAATATTAGNSSTLNGFSCSQLTTLIDTRRDFPNGTLVKTNIDYSKTNGDSFYMEIKGNTYSDARNSCYTQVQGYIYNNTIIAYGVTHLGVLHVTPITAMNIDGYLCFWFPRFGYWMGFDIRCAIGTRYGINRVTSIGDSAEPDGTKKVVLTDNTVYNINSSNIGSQWVEHAVTATNVNGGTVSATTGSFSSNVTVGENLTAKGVSSNWGDVWSDGTNIHPWYGLDLRTTSTGAYVTLSGYYGLTFRSGKYGIFDCLRVGIGTTSPAYTLDVNGSANATTIYENGTLLSSKYHPYGGSTALSFSASSITTTTSISVGSYLTIYGNTANNPSMYFLSSGVYTYIQAAQGILSFGDWQTGLQYVSSTGYIGIGTISPSYKLDVNGTMNATTIYENGSLLSGKYHPYGGTTSTALSCSSLTMNGGLSGATTGSFSSTVTAAAFKSSSICIECNNSGSSSGRGGEINNYNGQMYLQFNTANDLSLCYGGGKVGIGNALPQYKLDVSGTTRTNGIVITNGTQSVELTVDASGNLKINGNLYATGQVAAGV